MFIKEVFQIWFCFFHKFLKTRQKNILESLKFKKAIIIKIENILKINGVYAARLLQHPQKFVSILRHADRIIHNRGIYFKKMLDLKQKSLILFDHFFEKFYKIFYHKLPNPHPNLAGRLFFIQGIVVKESPVLVKKFKRIIDQNEKKHHLFSSKLNEQKKGFLDAQFSTKFESEFSQIEYQNIKLMSKIKNLESKELSELILTNISLLGKMTSISKIGKNISIWGIIRKNPSNISRLNNSINLGLTIDAVSIFLEKKKQSLIKKEYKFPSLFLDFLYFSQDMKIKGNEKFFIKKLFSTFLSKKFSDIFKTLIIFAALGEFQTNNLLELERGTINLCVIHYNSNRQYNLFYQIRKFFKNSIYISTFKNEQSDLFLCQQEILPFFKKKKNFTQLLKNPLYFFIDNIEFSNQKKINLVQALTSKKMPIIVFRGDNIKITRPTSVLAILTESYPSFNLKKIGKNDLALKFKKIKNFFDVFIWSQEHLLTSTNTFLPFFFPLQNKNHRNSFPNVRLFLNNYKSRSFSMSNISRYLCFLKYFKIPIFSLGAEKTLILWYISDVCEDIYPDKKVLFLEKLIKFAQANAKLYNRDMVLIQDTLFAISILEKLYFNSNYIMDLQFESKRCNSHPVYKKSSKFQFEKNNLFKSFQSSSRINLCNTNIYS